MYFFVRPVIVLSVISASIALFIKYFLFIVVIIAIIYAISLVGSVGLFSMYIVSKNDELKEIYKDNLEGVGLSKLAESLKENK